MDTPIDYRQYLELYDFLNQRGLTQGRDPAEYAQYFRNQYGTNLLSTGETSDWLRETSVRTNMALEQSPVGQWFGNVAGDVSSAFGFDRSVGEQVGQTIPRQGLNFAPVIAGAAVGGAIGGPIGAGLGALGTLATGAFSGADIYGESGSGLAGFITGGVNAAMPLVGRVGGKLVSPIASKFADEGINVLGTQLQRVTQKPLTEAVLELGGEVGLQTLVGEVGGIASNAVVRADIGGQNPVDAVGAAVSDFFTAENLFQTALGELPFFIGMDLPGKMLGVTAPDGTRLRTETEMHRYNNFETAKTNVQQSLAAAGVEVPEENVASFLRQAMADRVDINENAINQIPAMYETMFGRPKAPNIGQTVNNGLALPGPSGPLPLPGPVSKPQNFVMVDTPPPSVSEVPTEPLALPGPIQSNTYTPPEVDPLGDSFNRLRQIERRKAQDIGDLVKALGVDPDEIVSKDQEFFEQNAPKLQEEVQTNTTLRENFQKFSEIYSPREALSRAVKATISHLPAQKQDELNTILSRPSRLNAFDELERKGDVVGSKKTVNFDAVNNYINADTDIDSFTQSNESVMSQLASDRFEGRKWTDLSFLEQEEVKSDLEDASTEAKVDNVYKQLMGLARLGDDDLLVSALQGTFAKTKNPKELQRMADNLRKVLPYVFGQDEMMSQGDQRLRQLAARFEEEHGYTMAPKQFKKYIEAATKYFQDFYKQVGIEELYQQLPSKAEKAGKTKTAEIVERQLVQETDVDEESAAEDVEGQLRRSLRTVQDSRRQVQGGPARAKQVESERQEINAAVQLFSRLVESASDRFGMDLETLWSSIALRYEDTNGSVARADATGSYQMEFGQDAAHELLVKHLITLTHGADLSTVMHEGGHMYSILLETAALSGKADKQVVADYNTFKQFTGLKEGETWLQKMYDPEGAEAAEKFAEGLEKYLQEGKAPTHELKGLFAQIKQWLSEIFHFLKGELTPEVRDAYGRLFTTREQEASEAGRADRIKAEHESAKARIAPKSPEVVQPKVEASTNLSKPQNDFEALEYYGRTGKGVRFMPGDSILLSEDGLSGIKYKFIGMDKLADGRRRPRFESTGKVPESAELIEMDYPGGNEGLSKIIQDSINRGDGYVFSPKKLEELNAWRVERKGLDTKQYPPPRVFKRKRRSDESVKRDIAEDLRHFSDASRSSARTFNEHFIGQGNSPAEAARKAAVAMQIVQKLGVSPVKVGELAGQDARIRGLFSETNQLGRIAGLYFEKGSLATDYMTLGHEVGHALQLDYANGRLTPDRRKAFEKLDQLITELNPQERSLIIEEMIRALVPPPALHTSMKDFIFDTDNPNEFAATVLGISAMTGTTPKDMHTAKQNLKFLPGEVENFTKGVYRDLFEYSDAIASNITNPITANRFRALADQLKDLLLVDPESARLDAQALDWAKVDPAVFGEFVAQGEIPTAMEKLMATLFAHQTKRRIVNGEGPLGAGLEPGPYERNFQAFWQLVKKYPQLRIIEDLARSHRELAHAARVKLLEPFAVSNGVTKAMDPDYKLFGAIHRNINARRSFDAIRKEQNNLQRPLTPTEMDKHLRGVPRGLRDKVASLSMKFDKANLQAAEQWRGLAKDRMSIALLAKLQGLYHGRAKNSEGVKIPSIDKLDAIARNFVESKFDPSRVVDESDPEAVLVMEDTMAKLMPKYDRMDRTLKENPGYSPESADGFLVFYTKKDGQQVRLSAATRKQHKKNLAAAHADKEKDGAVSVQTPSADEDFGTVGIENRILQAYNDVEQDAYDAMVESITDPALQEQLRKEYTPGAAISRWNTAKTMNKHMLQRKGNLDDKGTYDYMLANLKYLNNLPHFIAREYVNGRKPLYLNDIALREHPNLVNLASAHINNVVNPLSPTVGAINNLNFMYFLGLNPSSAILDLSQSIFVAAPNLIRTGMGIGESYRTLGQSAQDALVSWSGKSTRDPVLDNILKRAYAEGVIDQAAGQMFYDEMEHMQHSIYRLGTPDGGLGVKQLTGDAWYWFNKAARSMYKNSSEFNGKVGLIAGYRAAKKQNPKASEEELYQAAKVFNQETNFGGGAAARPVFKDVDRIIGRNARGFAYSLSHYVTSMYGLYMLRAREALGQVPGADRRAATKALGIMAGTQALAGGAIGLPLVGSVFAIVNQFLGVDVENDLKEWVRKNSANPEGADNLMSAMFHGAGMFAGPLDVSARVGLGTVLGIDNYNTLGITDVMGPTVGIVDNLARAKTKWSNGDIGPTEAVVSALPSGVRRMLQATMDGGSVRGSQGKLVYQPDTGERIALGLGFQPRELVKARTDSRINYEAGLARNAELKSWRNQLAGMYDPNNPESALIIQREVLERQKDELSLDVSAELRNISRIIANRVVPDDPNRLGPKQGGRRLVSMPRISEVDRFLYEKQVESTLNPMMQPLREADMQKYQMIDQVVANYRSSVPEATAIVDLVQSGYPIDVAAASVLGKAGRIPAYNTQ